MVNKTEPGLTKSKTSLIEREQRFESLEDPQIKSQGFNISVDPESRNDPEASSSTNCSKYDVKVNSSSTEKTVTVSNPNERDGKVTLCKSTKKISLCHPNEFVFSEVSMTIKKKNLDKMKRGTYSTGDSNDPLLLLVITII